MTRFFSTLARRTPLFFTNGLLLILLLLGACKAEDEKPQFEGDQVFGFCDLSERRSLQQVYNLTDGQQVNRTNPIIQFSDQNCVDTLCSFFQLDLSTTPNYTLDFLLFAFVDGNIIDTLRGSETGTYDLKSCATSRIPGYDVITKNGIFELFPNGSETYDLHFSQQEDLLTLENFVFNDRILELSFVE